MILSWILYTQIFPRDPTQTCAGPPIDIVVLVLPLCESFFERGLAQTFSRLLCTNLTERSYQRSCAQIWPGDPSRDLSQRSCKHPDTIALILLEPPPTIPLQGLQRFPVKRSCRGIVCRMSLHVSAVGDQVHGRAEPHCGIGWWLLRFLAWTGGEHRL